MKKLTAIALLMVVVSAATASVVGEPRRPQADLSNGRVAPPYEALLTARTRVPHSYTVLVRGNLDGTMTRMPISYAAYRQGWQNNVSCRIENVGDMDVINPWLTINGVGDWRTLDNIVAEATRGCINDAEKARAIWEWERKHRFHACTWDAECDDAVKVHNVYGYTLCGDDAIIIDDMFKAAGLKTRPGRPVGHGVTEAFYDGAWHLLDGDEHVICLRRDNQTIASEAEVVRDHDLMKRTHTYSIGSGDSPLTDQFSASLYGYEGDRTGERKMNTQHTMFFTLRPGESVEWRWDHVGKEYSAAQEPKPGEAWHDGLGTLSEWGPTAYDNLRNGQWVYRAPLERPLWRKGAVSVDNVAAIPPPARPPGDEDEPALLARPADHGKPMTIAWKIATPWVLVGGHVECAYRLKGNNASTRLSFSTDGQSWQKIFENDDVSEPLRAVPRLEDLVSTRGKPTYQYYVKLELEGGPGSGISGVTFTNDVQMSLLGMPELRLGRNEVVYTDDTPGSRQVKVTHKWVEAYAWRPPTAPSTPISPANGTTVEGTQFTFRWQPAEAVAGEAATSGSRPAAPAIADYHIEVSDRPDMRWAISPNFEKLISRTPSKGKAEWAVPFVGLLNPDQTYYWHVRAMDSNGVWGPWSQRWSFRCQAPGVPLNLQATPQPDGTVQLGWQANPQGREPAAYKVYGSNEQGFTASDAEYVVDIGHGFCDTMDEYQAKEKGSPDGVWGKMKTPPNLVTKTEQTSLVVVGPSLDLPNTNKAFYRVVAIDDKGIESGPSDYAAVTRPFIYTAPVTQATAGQPYRYEPQSIFSIGHLTCQGGYNAAFWHREKLTWTLEQAPGWLKIENGVLVGTPPAAGKTDVALIVTGNKQQVVRQTFAIEVK